MRTSLFVIVSILGLAVMLCSAFQFVTTREHRRNVERAQAFLSELQRLEAAKPEASMTVPSYASIRKSLEGVARLERHSILAGGLGLLTFAAGLTGIVIESKAYAQRVGS